MTYNFYEALTGIRPKEFKNGRQIGSPERQTPGRCWPPPGLRRSHPSRPKPGRCFAARNGLPYTSRTPRCCELPEAERNRAVYNLRLAEQLGAETVTLRGRSIAEEIVNFARGRNITKIVVGKPHRSRWRTILSGSPVDDLVRQSGEIDVSVIAGEPSEPQKEPILILPKPLRLPGYEIGIIYFILATGLAFLMYPYFDLPNLIMVYLLASDGYCHSLRPGAGYP